MTTLDLFRRFSAARFSTSRWFTLLAAIALVTACGGSGGPESSNPNACGAGDCSPQAIIVIPATTAVYAGQAVTLDGSASRFGLTYKWQQTAGEAVALTGSTSPIAQFTAPTLTREQTLSFKLIVSDEYKDSPAEISFVVKPLAVTASASSDTAIPGTPLELRANGGDDSGDLRFEWEQIDDGGVPLTIEDATSATARITSRIVTVATSAIFRVTVTNKYNATAQAEISVKLAEGVIPSITSVMPSYAAPGEEVKISGSGFSGAIGVELIRNNQPTSASFSVVSDHEIALTIPSVDEGEYFLEIQNSGGTTQDHIKIANPLSDAVQVAAGIDHMCALFNDQTVSCWGSNSYGQLGDGTTVHKSHPTKVTSSNGETLDGIKAIGAGRFYTCALRTDGTVWCWGDNSLSQLGRDNSTKLLTRANKVSGLESISNIYAGFSHSCAINASKSIYCWGLNEHGQIGTSSSNQISTPTLINISNASSLSLGMDHSCAMIQPTNTIKCWGGNTYGQLGNGSTTDSASPVSVVSNTGPSELTNVVSMSAGRSHNCAVLADSSAVCWGNNSHGQLGSGDNIRQTRPIKVKNTRGDSSLTGVHKIFTSLAIERETALSNPLDPAEYSGASRTCAILTPGSVVCWGDNYHGQLGNGEVAHSNLPVDVQNLIGIVDLAIGGASVCALRGADGSIHCWGKNGDGLMGRGETGASTRPTALSTLSDVTLISTGGLYSSIKASFSCAITRQGFVYCWGHNDKGQLGTGKNIDSATPIFNGLSSGTSLSSGAAHNCAVSNSNVYCWGENTYAQINSSGADFLDTPTQIIGLPAIQTISAGATHNCALGVDGDVYCWGNNSLGQAGEEPAGVDAFTSIVKTPRKIELPPGRAVAIATGVSHSCAILNIGEIYCWGSNLSGELGNEGVYWTHIPIKVQMPANVKPTSISAGTSITCAATADTNVYCWGQNKNGELANGTSTNAKNPTLVTNLSGASSVAAGGVATLITDFGFLCALFNSNNGSVACWGNNFFNTLGSENNSDSSSYQPKEIAGLNGVIQIDSGGTHSCALYNDGQVTCWGGSYAAQLGLPPRPPLPVLP